MRKEIISIDGKGWLLPSEGQRLGEVEETFKG